MTLGETQARLWTRPAAMWRVLALCLAVFPQYASTPWPGEGAPGGGGAESIEGTVAVAVREATTAEEWFFFLSSSGLVIAVLAIVFLLPERYGRPATFYATLALGLLGVIAGWAAEPPQSGDLYLYCGCYVLGAGVLLVSGARAALQTSS